MQLHQLVMALQLHPAKQKQAPNENEKKRQMGGKHWYCAAEDVSMCRVLKKLYIVRG